MLGPAPPIALRAVAPSSRSNKAAASSATARAAKLAQKGKGRKVRFQGGALFPLAVSMIVVLGLLLVVYARESRPVQALPTTEEHWHHSYGFYLCGEWVQVEGAAEEVDSQGQLIRDAYRRSGVHSHDDGIIHWHAFTSAATGSNARLDVFLDSYGIELSDDRLTFPEDQRAQLPAGFEDGVFDEEDDVCVIDGEEEDASLRVVYWNNFADEDNTGLVNTANLDGLPLDRDAMALAIVFMPDNADITKPPSAPELPQLALNDSVQATPEGGLPDDLFSDAETDTGDGETGTDTGDAGTGESGADDADTGAGDTDSTDDG